MATTSTRPTTLATLVEAEGPCTTSLDAAMDYWQFRADRLLPLYLLAMAPHAAVVRLLIGAIAGEQRSRVEHCCLYLVAATLWRWVWLARLQHQVQEDLRSQREPIFWSRVPQILLIRLFGNIAITWGSILAGVPTFYGFFVGSFAAPLLLESDEPSTTRVRQSLSWIHHSAKRLFHILMVMTAITVLLIVAMFVSQFILARTVLPSLLGVDTADLNLTLDGLAWRLSLFYFIFLLLDAFWAVASVFVYYDSQSRRLATDLRARLIDLTEGVA